MYSATHSLGLVGSMPGLHSMQILVDSGLVLDRYEVLPDSYSVNQRRQDTYWLCSRQALVDQSPEHRLVGREEVLWCVVLDNLPVLKTWDWTRN